MALINVTPVMTSNTTPAPYVVSASSIYAAVYDSWKAFNGTSNAENDSWVTVAGSVTGWIMIDFSVSTKVNAISIKARNYTDLKPNIKDFSLYGSNDGSLFTLIKTFPSQVEWIATEERLFMLDLQVNFRYYKIVVVTNNGQSYSAIGDIKFLQDDGVTTYVTNQKATGLRCLPKNSTLAMTQRQNDPREGLLGFADDGDNYGTLWIVDKTGKAIIPMSRIANSEVLFQGTANVEGAICTLSKSYKNYQYLIVLGGIGTTSVLSPVFIPVKDIVNNNVSQFGMSIYATASIYYYITFAFATETTFSVSDIISGTWGGVGISKIIGIK